TSLPMMPGQLEVLRNLGFQVTSIYLDAASDTLLRRYSETRRRHPLSGRNAAEGERALTESIEYERELLSNLRESAHIIDTSLLRAAQLQSYVKSLVSSPAAKLTLVFESFAFKRGIPLDADYVFDVRMLPNPHYESALRPMSGKDEPVQKFLQSYSEVNLMQSQIESFLDQWLPALEKDHRNYITVAIGCTGGQHRSVYLVEKLSQRFATNWLTLKRHRELDSK
ncbi:MAG: RNase adapter RapZ, partial [Betaproteobacteria bacterium]|nr:RNase adapter RapZ [Betaproteobacteria bacterium]